MVIIGCDYHPSMQQIAWLDTATGRAASAGWSTAAAKPRGFTAS